MDVLFNEFEEMLKQSTRSTLELEAPPSLVREAEADPLGYSPVLWKKLAELGWTGLALPTGYGGQGLGLSSLGIVMAELGRAVAPVPFHCTMTAALTIAEAGNDNQRAAILPGVVQGDTILTWALTEADPRFLTPDAVQMQATVDGDSLVLNGTKLFVEHFESSGQCLVVCRTSPGKTGAAGISVVLVDPKSAGLTVTPLANIAKEKLSRVDFTNVRVPRSNVIGVEGEGWAIVEGMVNRAAALLSIQMSGAARRALEYAVEYAKGREAFGRPIGAFQSIAHTLADTIIWIDGCDLIAYEALWRLEQGLPAAVQVSQAKAFCSEKVVAAVRNANVVHGGIAATAELNLQLWFRRASAWATRLGTPSEHRARVAHAVLDRA
ncbi:MAG: acyl-CoA/acyl-ACP dehydrogenase [Chloroflexi bacterium]|nr:acyl-CoA/acyl-ACP dehydrogenase [Chloroflexota bacterium]